MNNTFNISLDLKNNVSYKVYNATIQANPSDCYVVELLKAYSQKTANISSDNTTIIFDELLPDESIQLNWTVMPGRGGVCNISMNFTTYYGSYGNNSNHVIVNQIGDVFEINISLPQTTPVSEEFNMSIMLKNNASYMIYNATVNLDIESWINTSTLIINKSDTNISPNNKTLIFENLSAGE